MSWEQLNKTHSHLTLESDKLLNHMNKNLLKHNNTVSLLYVEKLVITYETSTMQSNKMEWEIWLDQTGNHYKIVTTMLIHTWNEHPDIQANKLNANHLHAQHSTNAQYIKYMHLGTKSYKGTRVRILKENA